ncbi:MAG TPA: thioesterase family protein [Bryobacteraceae bacterium]|nr:thioesterase family protein [Bryobacteraceae bacterium]
MTTNRHVHETRIRVRYAETDQMGVAYHSNHLIWMEIGRVEYCRSIGIHYREMEESDGILLAVVEAQCRYLYPARYDDEVIIATSVAKLGTRSIAFDYELRLGDTSRGIASGHTKHVFCDQSLRPVRLPAKYARLFRAASEAML